MKTLKNCILLFAFVISNLTLTSQDELEKVWDLLLKNKRVEALKLFDKTLNSKKDSDIDLFFTHLILQKENGKIFYKDEGIDSFIKFPNSDLYLKAISIYHPYFEFEISAYSPYKSSIVDKLFQLDKFKTNPNIIDAKLVFDKYQKIQPSTPYNINTINNWQVCGVFENLNNSGLHSVYEPELYAKNDKDFNAGINGIVSWYNPKNNYLTKGYYNSINENIYGSGIIYNQIFIESNEDKLVDIYFEYANGIKIFLNDSEIYFDDDATGIYGVKQKLRLKLNKGFNRLLVKYELTASINNKTFFSITDTFNKVIPSLIYHNTYKPYTKTIIDPSSIQTITSDDEIYFKSKVNSIKSRLIDKYFLSLVYRDNGKLKELKNSIDQLEASYPMSSLVKSLKLEYHALNNQGDLIQDIRKSIEVNDSFYYINSLYDFLASETLFSKEKSELIKKRENTKYLIDSIFYSFFDFALSIKDEDKSSLTKKADKIAEYSNYSHTLVVPFADLYNTIDNDVEKYLKIVKNINSNYNNIEAFNSLLSYYIGIYAYDTVRQMYDKLNKLNPGFNTEIYNHISFLMTHNEYEKAISLADSMLENFPFSFEAMELKGDIYKQLKNKEKTVFWYKKALQYNANNVSLLKKIHEYTEFKDELELARTQDIYNFIKNNRGKGKKSSTGVNYLLDEYIVNVYEQGIYKTNSYLIYEVTSKQGIEELKEINKRYTVDYIKSEIIKSDGSILPLEEGGSFVATNLEIGDVILLDFESYETNYGRFYKDFNLWNYFVNKYPCSISRFGIIYDDKIKFNHKIFNGQVEYKLSKIKGKNYSQWTATNLDEMPESEEFGPKFNDKVFSMTASTIKSWSEIANWYVDLIGNTLKLDNEAIAEFDKIFPNGYKSIDQESRAKMIYYYITKNINYSSQDFRQSGHIPQKPSKTIRTKLGDCKDVSSLFVALATRAELDAKMVLVLTNDNGTTHVVLPEINFNHMIVKLNINGKEKYIEMTDKDAGFGAYSQRLQNAIGLVINLNKKANDTAKLINVYQDFENQKFYIQSKCTIKDNSVSVKSTFNLHGNTSYFSRLLFEENTEKEIKKQFEEVIGETISKPILFQSYSNIKKDTANNSLSFDIDYTIQDKLQSLGSIKLFSLPYYAKPYNVSLIKNEKRITDIIYALYENIKTFDYTIDVFIDAEKKFVEVPQNSTLSYKKHKFNINYNLISPNHLQVKTISNTSLDNISTTEYIEFKTYVDSVLNKLKDVVGFK